MIIYESLAARPTSIIRIDQDLQSIWNVVRTFRDQGITLATNEVSRLTIDGSFSYIVYTEIEVPITPLEARDILETISGFRDRMDDIMIFSDTTEPENDDI